MKRATAFAFAIFSAAPAYAADLYAPSLKDEPVYERPHVWTGAYVGVHLGYSKVDNGNGIVVFDTNLDGTYGDTVNNLVNPNAFAPSATQGGGFCSGATQSSRIADGCSDDDDSFDIGVRLGYDKQYG